MCAGSYTARLRSRLLCEREEVGEADDHVVGRREQVRIASRRSVASRSRSGRHKLLSSLVAVVSVVRSGKKERGRRRDGDMDMANAIGETRAVARQGSSRHDEMDGRAGGWMDSGLGWSQDK